MKLDRRNDPVTITDFRRTRQHDSGERATLTVWLMFFVIITALVVGAVVE
jgi:hypothetical protein